MTIYHIAGAYLILIAAAIALIDLADRRRGKRAAERAGVGR